MIIIIIGKISPQLTFRLFVWASVCVYVHNKIATAKINGKINVAEFISSCKFSNDSISILLYFICESHTSIRSIHFYLYVLGEKIWGFTFAHSD